MGMKTLKAAGLFMAVVLGLAGCGSAGSKTALGSAYLPVTPGSTWTYSRSDGGTQTQTVTGNANNQVTREVIDSTSGKSVASITVSNNALYLGSMNIYDANGSIVMTKTYSPTPGQLFIPSSVTPGTHEAQTVQINTQPGNTNSSLSLEVTVVGTEPVTVPAGTFSDALKIQTVITSGPTYTSWFALQVGMIRQDVNNVKAVELTSYTIK